MGAAHAPPRRSAALKSRRLRVDIIFEALQPIAHHEGVLGNHATIMTRDVRRVGGGWANVATITGDTMRHQMRYGSSLAVLRAADMLGETLSEGALRLLFAGGMVTGRGDPSTINLDRYRELCELVPNEAALRRLLMNAMWAKVTVAHFTEPDLGDSLTAIAIEPGARGAKLCRGLPCALPYEGVTIGLDVDDRGCLMKSYNEQRMPCSAAMSMRFAIMVVERLGGADMATLNAMERRFEELMAGEANDGRSVVGCNGTVLATI